TQRNLIKNSLKTNTYSIFRCVTHALIPIIRSQQTMLPMWDAPPVVRLQKCNFQVTLLLAARMHNLFTPPECFWW
ncbi:MAG TPA: hypothetical protein VK663_00955, partial [Burkholderiales bacterium]|nr:hypothetical protein [Burkholderiales bacterium]